MNAPKGYYIGTGYMGWVPWYNNYILFATEEEYYDYINERKDEQTNESNK